MPADTATDTVSTPAFGKGRHAGIDGGPSPPGLVPGRLGPAPARARWRSLRLLLRLLYLTALHLAAGWALWTSSIPAWVADRLNWGSSWVEFDSAYKRRAAGLRRVDEVALPGGVVFVGDSHVAALDAGVLADHAINLGIAGDTSRRVAARVGDYRSVKEARAVLVHVGTNDPFYRPLDAFARTYGEILAAVPAGVPVLASLILPSDARVHGSSGRATVAAYNGAIRQACAERPGCVVVDAGAALADAGGSLAPAFHTGDGTHLSREGYAAWIEALRPALAPYAKAAG